VDLLVTLGEFSGYVIQERTDLNFRKGDDPGDNSARSLGILVPERTEKNSGLVRAEDRGRALDAYRRGGDHGLVNLEKRARKPAIVFGANSLPNPARVTPVVRLLRTDLKSPTERMIIALPALVDVGFMF
jgi:hypothetical protein